VARREMAPSGREAIIAPWTSQKVDRST